MLFSNIIFFISLTTIVNAQNLAQDTINTIDRNLLPIDDGEPFFPFPKIDYNYTNSEINYFQWNQTGSFTVIENYFLKLDKKIEISNLWTSINDLEFSENQLPNLVIFETNRIWVNQN